MTCWTDLIGFSWRAFFGFVRFWIRFWTGVTFLWQKMHILFTHLFLKAWVCVQPTCKINSQPLKKFVHIVFTLYVLVCDFGRPQGPKSQTRHMTFWKRYYWTAPCSISYTNCAPFFSGFLSNFSNKYLSQEWRYDAAEENSANMQGRFQHENAVEENELWDLRFFLLVVFELMKNLNPLWSVDRPPLLLLLLLLHTHTHTLLEKRYLQKKYWCAGLNLWRPHPAVRCAWSSDHR